MFFEDFSAVIQAAKTKVRFMQSNAMGYFLSSMLAGMFIGFAVLLVYTIGGVLEGAPYTKAIMGASFGIALSLVTVAGAELFTGNNLIMCVGMLSKAIRPLDAAKLWAFCWVGNLAGAVVLALMFYGAGFATGAVGEFIATSAATKMGIAALPLFLRGVLCNILVCLATWCGFRCKSESGKLIMVFWCLYAFITCGFEHSIANMTLFTISLLAPFGAAVSIGGYFYNLLVVTIGNMVGGILFVAVPYYFIAKKQVE